MAGSLNKVLLIGRLGNDPEIKPMQNGKNVAILVQKYLKKGSQVYVEGQLNTSKYTDNNGQEKFSTQIVIQGYNSSLTMLGASSKSNDNSINQDSPSNLPSGDNDVKSGLDDEVPF